MITHDLGVIAEIADDVLVMYAGRAVETRPHQADPHAPRDALHLGTALQRARRHRRRRGAADPDPGQPAQPAEPTQWLRLPPALRLPGQGARRPVPHRRCRTCRRPWCGETHRRRCHLPDPDVIYATEILPEIAPDLIDADDRQADRSPALRTAGCPRRGWCVTRCPSPRPTPPRLRARPGLVLRRFAPRGQQPQEVLPGQGIGRAAAHRRPTCRRSTGSRSPWNGAGSSAWWGSPAAASPRPDA